MWKSPKERYRFNKSGITYQERAGDNINVFDLLGRVVFHFNFLDEQISLAIIKLLKVDKKIGHIVTSELSFKNKINILGSLYLVVKD